MSFLILTIWNIKHSTSLSAVAALFLLEERSAVWTLAIEHLQKESLHIIMRGECLVFCPLGAARGFSLWSLYRADIRKAVLVTRLWIDLRCACEREGLFVFVWRACDQRVTRPQSAGKGSSPPSPHPQDPVKGKSYWWMDGTIGFLCYTYIYVTHEKVQQRPRISSTHCTYERIYRKACFCALACAAETWKPCLKGSFLRFIKRMQISRSFLSGGY